MEWGIPISSSAALPGYIHFDVCEYVWACDRQVMTDAMVRALAQPPSGPEGAVLPDPPLLHLVVTRSMTMRKRAVGRATPWVLGRRVMRTSRGV